MSSLCTGPPQFNAAQRKADADAIIKAAKSLPSVSMIEAHVRLVKNLLGADLDAWKVGGSDENRSGMATDARGDQTDPHLLNTEDEATEDEGGVGHITPSPQAVAKPMLYVGTSNVIGWWKGGGLGLFSHAPIHAGELIGFYTGAWYREEDYEQLPDDQRQRLDEYAVNVQPELSSDHGTPMVVSPPFVDGADRPDPTLHPMAFANEATKPLSANAAFTRVQLNADDISGSIPDDQADGEFIGLAVYACKEIGKHREILVHYGSCFPRQHYGYSVGAPCHPPDVTQSPTALGAVPLTALAFVEGSASDVGDSSDESYSG